MKKLTALLALLLALLPLSAAQEKKFPTGARPTPPHKIAAAIAAGQITVHKVGAVAPPPQVVRKPPRLSPWGNDQYGDCVTAESAAADAAYSAEKLGDANEIFIPEANVISWARSHGVLNGADLLSVIQMMQQDGIKDEKGILRKAGVPSVVDFSNESALQSAIAAGPISIAIASASLPSGAGNNMGWYVFGSRASRNTDHCVSLFGYGPAKVLFEALGVALPAGVDPNKICYLLYTWNTIGIVDHAWLMSTCEEAWLRTPTILDLPTPPPPPPPPPPPGPGPVGGIQVTIGADVKAGTYQLVPSTAEVVPAGTLAKLNEVSAKVKELADLLKMKRVEPAPVPETKKEDSGKTPEPTPEIKEPPVKEKKQVRLLDYGMAREYAIWHRKPLFVGVGCDPPVGENFVSARVETPFNGWHNETVIFAMYNAYDLEATWWMEQATGKVHQIEKKETMPEKWNPYRTYRDPTTGKVIERAVK